MIVLLSILKLFLLARKGGENVPPFEGEVWVLLEAPVEGAFFEALGAGWASVQIEVCND